MLFGKNLVSQPSQSGISAASANLTAGLVKRANPGGEEGETLCR